MHRTDGANFSHVVTTTTTYEVADGAIAHPFDVDFPEDPICSEQDGLVQADSGSEWIRESVLSDVELYVASQLNNASLSAPAQKTRQKHKQMPDKLNLPPVTATCDGKQQPSRSAEKTITVATSTQTSPRGCMVDNEHATRNPGTVVTRLPSVPRAGVIQPRFSIATSGGVSVKSSGEFIRHTRAHGAQPKGDRHHSEMRACACSVDCQVKSRQS